MNDRKVSRREFMRFTALTGTGAIVAACAPVVTQAPPAAPAAEAPPAAAPAAAQPAPTTVPAPAAVSVVTIQQIDEKGDILGGKGTEETIKAFEAENPGIHIERVIAPSAPSETWTVINSALASDKPPDVFWGSGRGSMKDLARKGVIMDLTDEIKSWGYTFLPGTETQLTYQEKLYSAPYWIQFKFMTYDKQIFEKNSLSIPTTWTEWQSTCEALKKANIIPCAFGCQGGDQWASLNWVWLLNQKMMGIKEVAANMEVETGTYENPLYETALDLLVAMNDKGYFGTNPISVPHQVAQAELFGGKAASLYSGTWDLTTMLDSTKCPPDFLDRAALESKIWHDASWAGEAYAVQGGTMGWDVPVKAQHKTEALKWLKFYCGPQGAQIYHHATQYFMANTGYKPEFSQPGIVKLADSLKGIDGMVDFGDQSGDPNVWPVYCSAIEAALNHESSAKEAMDKVRVAAKTAREKANA